MYTPHSTLGREWLSGEDGSSLITGPLHDLDAVQVHQKRFLLHAACKRAGYTRKGFWNTPSSVENLNFKIAEFEVVNPKDDIIAHS